MNNKFNTKRIIYIGLFAAIAFAATFINIPINILGNQKMIHLGTTAIFIASILIGKDAGWSGAIGCALFDLSNPAFAIYAIPTFIAKGATGYFAGKIAFSKGKNGEDFKTNIIGFIVGAVASLTGYFLYDVLIFGKIETAIVGLPMSIITSTIAICITLPIAAAIKVACKKYNVSLSLQ